MPRYKITIEYDGTPFIGWQRQKGGKSIQQALEAAIKKFSKEKTEVYGSGRTDAGVHALGQVGHFDLKKDYPAHEVMGAINFHLIPHPISVLNAEKVDDDFHARFSAKERSYVYRIINRRAPLVLEKQRAWHVPRKLNVKKMKEAASYLVGRHDFTSFRSTICQSKSPVKTLDEITIRKKGDVIEITVRAKSFLHHMVRNIVGTLHNVGVGKWEPEEVKRILKAKDRKSAGVNAPPHGLYFLNVEY